jgi:glycosyltransferase involved in cell wall biosynthesis
MKLFVFAIGAHDRASSRLRVWDHLPWLRGQGFEVAADSLMAHGVKGATAGFFARFIARYPLWLARFFRADAVLIQESLALWPAVLLRNLGKRRRLVFDFSDPVDRVGRGAKRRLREWLFGLTVRRADAVIVENKLYLERLGRDADALHFYGPVNASRYAEARERRPERARDAPLRLGWTGSPGTFRLLAPILPAIDALARERPIELFLIGAGEVGHAFEHARLIQAEWHEDREFEQVPTFDLGLFRLDDNEDSRWRGAGKLFIYMAAGVPFIATDAGISGTLIRESGIGFPVADDRWLDALRAAAQDADARADFSERSLRFARDKLSYEMYRAQLAGQLTGRSQEDMER